jgi:hypothetical protein
MTFVNTKRPPTGWLGPAGAPRALSNARDVAMLPKPRRRGAARRSFPCRSCARSPSRPAHIGGCYMTEEKQKTGLDLTRADSLNRCRLLLP